VGYASITRSPARVITYSKLGKFTITSYMFRSYYVLQDYNLVLFALTPMIFFEFRVDR